MYQLFVYITLMSLRFSIRTPEFYEMLFKAVNVQELIYDSLFFSILRKQQSLILPAPKNNNTSDIMNFYTYQSVSNL